MAVEQVPSVAAMIKGFDQRRQTNAGQLATDQLLNAVHLLTKGFFDLKQLDADKHSSSRIESIVLRALSNVPGQDAIGGNAGVENTVLEKILKTPERTGT
jgi:hypothetical protein